MLLGIFFIFTNECTHLFLFVNICFGYKIGIAVILTMNLKIENKSIMTIKTFPNLLWLFLNLVFLSFFGIMILVCLEWIFDFIAFFKNSNENKIGMIVLLFFVSLLFLYYYYQLSNNFTFAKINSNGIVLYQLLKLKIKKLSFEEISGYSKSIISYGRVPLNFTSKSIIIYSKRNEQFELIKIFNLNFENFEKEFRKTEIKYFGKEAYQTEKIYKRKYKYLK